MSRVRHVRGNTLIAEDGTIITREGRSYRLPGCTCAYDSGQSMIYAVVHVKSRTTVWMIEDSTCIVIDEPESIDVINIFTYNEDYVFSTVEGVRFVLDSYGKRKSHIDIPNDSIAMVGPYFVNSEGKMKNAKGEECPSIINGYHDNGFRRIYGWYNNVVIDMCYPDVHAKTIFYYGRTIDDVYIPSYSKNGNVVILSDGKLYLQHRPDDPLVGNWKSAPFEIGNDVYVIDEDGILRDIRYTYMSHSGEQGNMGTYHGTVIERRRKSKNSRKV